MYLSFTRLVTFFMWHQFGSWACFATDVWPPLMPAGYWAMTLTPQHSALQYINLYTYSKPPDLQTTHTGNSFIKRILGHNLYNAIFAARMWRLIKVRLYIALRSYRNIYSSEISREHSQDWLPAMLQTMVMLARGVCLPTQWIRRVGMDADASDMNDDDDVKRYLARRKHFMCLSMGQESGGGPQSIYWTMLHPCCSPGQQLRFLL